MFDICDRNHLLRKFAMKFLFEGPQGRFGFLAVLFIVDPKLYARRRTGVLWLESGLAFGFGDSRISIFCFLERLSFLLGVIKLISKYESVTVVSSKPALEMSDNASITGSVGFTIVRPESIDDPLLSKFSRSPTSGQSFDKIEFWVGFSTNGVSLCCSTRSDTSPVNFKSGWITGFDSAYFARDKYLENFLVWNTQELKMKIRWTMGMREA